MRIVMFYHTLLSDWNHGNAHFLRGIVSELLGRGHDVQVFEREDSWSMRNLLAEHGSKPLHDFAKAYPHLHSTRYNREALNIDQALARADLVIVHEWNSPEVVRNIGEHRAANDHYRLFFHDTHHRMISAPEQMAAYDLSNYDGVLAYGRVLQRMYEQEGYGRRAFVWHEAADTRVFHPRKSKSVEYDLVWIGNWGDNERAEELHEFLIEPIRRLKLKARIYGVRYPDKVKGLIDYGGWLPNFKVPEVFARARVTVHVPRRPYVKALPGIPTIRPFEAMACRIPLICSPWEDVEGLFRPGTDYLLARDGKEMTEMLRAVLNDRNLAEQLSASGLETIRARHTCAHRVDELLNIYSECRRPKLLCHQN
ncbi:MAG TPA: glycosyltransferase [Verrucomicrobiae bacterium]|nr:glycosyltransferase [Verrucomicrobiae bacterium]